MRRRRAAAGGDAPAGASEAALVVALGGSAGGLDAVRAILAGMPKDLGAAVLVVQHRARASEALAHVLQLSSALPVVEAEDKDTLEAGRVYVAPADYHLLVERGHVALSTDEPVLFSRPSIDVTFETLAEAYGPDALGVVLTGANADGAAGLRHIVDRGGAAVVQDPHGAESPTMPRAALAATPEATVVPLEEIADALVRWTRSRHVPCAEISA